MKILFNTEKYTIPNNLSNFLDLLRWISAFLVVIHHIITSIIIESNKIHEINFLLKTFYFITSLGPEAVIIFFVLSGFLVGGNVLELYCEKNFIWKKYLINRLTRLYVVLLPALILGLFFDYLGSNLFPKFYSNILEFGPYMYDINSRVSFNSFIVNFFMLQTSWGPQFGSNGPLWSLAYEFWYYILFPLILGVLFEKNIKKIFLYLLIIILIFLLLDLNIFIYFSYWLIGVAIYLLLKINFTITKNIYISSIIFILALLISSNHILFIRKLDLLLVALSTGYLIYCMSNKNFLNYSLNKKISEFSYTLYLMHAPLLIFILGFFNLDKRMTLNENIYYFIIITLIIYVYSILMYILFEKHTISIRNKLKKSF